MRAGGLRFHIKLTSHAGLQRCVGLGTLCICSCSLQSFQFGLQFAGHSVCSCSLQRFQFGLQFAALSVWAAVCRTFSLQDFQFAAAVCSAFSLGCSLQHFQFGLQFAALSVCSCSLQHFQFAAECLQSVHTMVVLKFYQLTCVHIKRTAQLATLTHPLST